MNKKKKTPFGNYSYSIRTSGEVVSLFVRDATVICTLELFIATKVHLFYYKKEIFLICNKIFNKCLFTFKVICLKRA